MKRKLLLLAALFGICIQCLASRPAPSSSFPVCGHPYCGQNPNNPCTCPGGTKRGGQAAPCDTWFADCDEL